MAKKFMVCTCTACGEPLTAPIFHLGKPYGWSCASRIFPKLSKPKKVNYVIAESYEVIEGELLSGARFIVRALYDGKRYRCYFFRTSKEDIVFYKGEADAMVFADDKLVINLDKYKR
jgi:hypothetical protein